MCACPGMLLLGEEGYWAKHLVGWLSTSLKNGPNRIWQGSKKGGQLDWKLGKRGSIGLNINTMRGQSDQAWLFEGFEDAEKGTQSDWKSQKRGSSPRNLPTMPKYGSTCMVPGHENWMRLVHGVCIGGCWEFDSCHSHTVLYTWLNGSCQTISKIPLDSINQTQLILVFQGGGHSLTWTWWATSALLTPVFYIFRSHWVPFFYAQLDLTDPFFLQKKYVSLITFSSRDNLT